MEAALNFAESKPGERWRVANEQTHPGRSVLWKILDGELLTEAEGLGYHSPVAVLLEVDDPLWDSPEKRDEKDFWAIVTVANLLKIAKPDDVWERVVAPLIE
jgi:hypothetical protein